MTTPYVHDETVHNVQAANEIVPALIDIFHPHSVLDFGCGIGTFLSVFKRLGVNDVLGVDGPWVDQHMLEKYLASNEFLEADLRHFVRMSRNFDLVISLEVAEHLDERHADVFLDSITAAGDTIVFSAAIPGQGGQNHLNEQPLSYWIQKF